MGFLPEALLAVSATSAVAGNVQRNRARGEQRAAAANQRRLSALENFRERRESIRQARIARGAAVAEAASGQGSVEGSGVRGVSSSIASQLEFNLDFINRAEKLGFAIQANRLSASELASSANQFSALSSLSLTGARLAHGGFFENTSEDTSTSTPPSDGDT